VLGRVSSSHHIILVTLPVISHERGKEDVILTTTNVTYMWSLDTEIFRSG